MAINVRHDHYIHYDNDVLLEKLNLIIKQNQKIMEDLSVLEQEVAETKTVTESAVVLLKDLTARIIAAGVDPVKLKSLTDSLSASTDALAAAVTENTPAE